MKEDVRVKPVFVMSVMRSGSTLLQRILARHSKISSHSEPWLLLPLLYSTKHKGIVTEYGHSVAARAIQELDSSEYGNPYSTEMRNFVEAVYSRLADKGSVYFIDKTPRYFYIVDDIKAIFPNAKFIFLWRDPSHVIASLVNTAFSGKWLIHEFTDDLSKGFRALVSASNKFEDHAFAIKYEDLTEHPVETVASLCRFLELDFEEDMLQVGSFDLAGSLGDPVKSNLSRPIQRGRDKVGSVLLNNWLRKRDTVQLLASISMSDYEAMGYDKLSISNKVEQAKLSSVSRGIVRDWYLSRRVKLKNALKRRLFNQKQYKFEVVE